MPKKKERDVYVEISKILKIKIDVLKDSKNLSQIEEWDSLNHLNILIKLDQMFNNKVSLIPEMGKADSMKKILKLLKENNLIN